MHTNEQKKTFRKFFSMWNLLWPFLFIHIYTLRDVLDLKRINAWKNHTCESTQHKKGGWDKVENKYSLSKRLWMFVPTFLINSFFFHFKVGTYGWWKIVFLGFIFFMCHKRIRRDGKLGNYKGLNFFWGKVSKFTPRNQRKTLNSCTI